MGIPGIIYDSRAGLFVLLRPCIHRLYFLFSILNLMRRPIVYR